MTFLPANVWRLISFYGGDLANRPLRRSCRFLRDALPKIPRPPFVPKKHYDYGKLPPGYVPYPFVLGGTRHWYCVICLKRMNTMLHGVGHSEVDGPQVCVDCTDDHNDKLEPYFEDCGDHVMCDPTYVYPLTIWRDSKK